MVYILNRHLFHSPLICDYHNNIKSIDIIYHNHSDCIFLVHINYLSDKIRCCYITLKSFIVSDISITESEKENSNRNGLLSQVKNNIIVIERKLHNASFTIK